MLEKSHPHTNFQSTAQQFTDGLYYIYSLVHLCMIPIFYMTRRLIQLTAFSMTLRYNCVGIDVCFTPGQTHSTKDKIQAQNGVIHELLGLKYTVCAILLITAKP